MSLHAPAAPPGTVRRLALPPPPVSAETILRFQKYRDLGRVPGPIRKAAEDAAREASGLTAPEAVLWRGPVTEVDGQGSVTLAGAHRFGSRVLARLLAEAEEAIVAVLSVGPAIDERAREFLAEQLLVEGFLMDVAGWVAIEGVVRALRQRLLAEERPAGRTVTHRMAPGYCDWPLEEQGALLAVFGDEPLPVTLNEASCMLPRKSISAVFGVVRPARG